MITDELVKAALVGASRITALPAVEGAPGEAIAAASATTPEARLLAAMAIASRYESCGRTPAKVESLPAVAPADAMPGCTRRAGELLGQILAMTNTPAKQQLLDEWLSAALAAERHAPHALLPLLLDYAASYRALRDKIAAAGDARAGWLMAQNPRWQVAAAATEDAAALWSTGGRDQRVSALRRLRAMDPARAVDLVRGTWKEDGADERSAFVEALAVGLSDADESFLESALDDKSKQVRAATVELLARLPNSAFVTRMTARAETMLTFAGGKIEVKLPSAFDPTWQRDGVIEKPDQRIGQKQWWLRQIVAAIPVTHWSARWSLKPADVVAALPVGFTTIVLEAWTESAGRIADAGWVAALLLRPMGKQFLRYELLNPLPADARDAIAEAVIGGDLKLEHVSEFLQKTTFRLSRAAAATLARQIYTHAATIKDTYDYRLSSVLHGVALRFPPVLYAELSAKWTPAAASAWETNRKALDQCLQTLQLRYDIQREFAS